MNSPGYTPYNPTKSKRLSTQSTQSFVRPRDSPTGATAASSVIQRSATPDSPAFPFQSVPAGASPFPPSTPKRVASPAPNGRASSPVASGSNGNGVRAQSPSRGMVPGMGPKETGRTPYRNGFQPQGVRRDRTEEFLLKRRDRSDGKKLEEGRLGRRMEKLVALHFPPPAAEAPAASSPRLSLSSISELSGTLRSKSAKDLWRSVAGSKSEIERAEQGIVKWQDDAQAIRCPICMASFGLKTRRHHCRLCGRVVCFLPPSPASEFLHPISPTSNSPVPIPKPVRRERCSTFFTYEYEGVLVGGEKKPVGVIVEIEPVEPDNSFGAIANEAHQVKEKDERKRVRLCRDCMNIVLRQQEQNLPPVTPNWLKLYEVLVQLEKEIEEALPEFQELVLSVQKPSAASAHHPSASAAQSLRKRLLSNLASYDTIAKRIRELPLTDGSVPGEKLALLRTLGDIDDGSKAKKKKTVSSEPTVKSLASLLGKPEVVNGKLEPDLETSSKLAVLLEQEALVRGYVDDANARRQFEDAASLKASLDELREEINRVRAQV